VAGTGEQVSQSPDCKNMMMVMMMTVMMMMTV
jgi:hypothetical protein